MTLIPSHLRSIVNEDGAVILNSAHNQITTLDAMGGYIWRKLELGSSEEEIVEHLVQETGEAREIIQADLTVFLGDLAAKRLLTIESISPNSSR